jgi:hypothetical protein
MRGPHSFPNDTVQAPTPDTRKAPNITLPNLNAGGTISYCSLTSTIAPFARRASVPRATGHAVTTHAQMGVACAVYRAHRESQAPVNAVWRAGTPRVESGGAARGAAAATARCHRHTARKSCRNGIVQHCSMEALARDIAHVMVGFSSTGIGRMQN